MDFKEIRKDFPIFNKKIEGYPLIYFDNTATTQKPFKVIDAISDFYKNYNANIHRGVHRLSQEASDLYEEAHRKTGNFINCNWDEVVFTRNTTESINLVANCMDFKKGDEVIVSLMEHHSNIVPWQILEKRKGIVLKFVEVNNGELDIEDLKSKISNKTKLVSMTHVSNVLGTINPVGEIAKITHENNAYFLVDGAQSAPHMKIDVKKMGCDFFAFSSHKMLGPTGIGVLYGKKEIMEEMRPFITGGDMIEEVFEHHSTWNTLPWKYEAGTPNIAGAVGFSAALDYLNSIGMQNVENYIQELTKYALEKIDAEIYGPKKRAGIISFNLRKIHPHDVAYLLDKKGIAVRSGNHCAQPLMRKLNILGTVRASFYIYNTKEEIDFFVKQLEEIRRHL